MSIQNFTDRLKISPRFRQAVALAGLILAAGGQIFLSLPSNSKAWPSPTADWIQNNLRLALPSVENVWQGALVLLAGALIYLFFSPGSAVFPHKPAEAFASWRRPGFRDAWPFLLLVFALWGGLLLQLNRLEYRDSSPWLWLAALALAAWVAAGWDRQAGVDLSLGVTRPDTIAVLILLLAGLLITTYRLQGWPDQMMPDEGIFGFTARDIVTGEFTPPLFAQGVDTFPILATYWQAWIMQWAGITLWGWRFASVIPGVLAVVPLYFLARDLFNRRLAFLSGVIFLTIPYFLVYARLGYTNIQPLFILTLALYLIHTALRKASHSLMFLAGMVAGLGFYTYFSGRAAIVVGALLLGLAWLARRVSGRGFGWALLLFIGAALLTAMPHLVYGFRQNTESMSFRIVLSFFNSAAYGRAYFSAEELARYTPMWMLGDVELFFNPPVYLALIARGFVQTILAYQKAGMLWGEHYLAAPLAGTFGAVLFVWGLIAALKEIRQHRFQWVLVWFFSVITIFSVLNTYPPREDHMVPAIPALSVLIALGVTATFDAIQGWVGWLEKSSKWALACAALCIGLGGIYDYFVLGPAKFPARPEDVMSWAGLAAQDESLLFVFDQPVRDNFYPSALKEFGPEVPFEALPLEEMLQTPTLLQPDRKIILFYFPALDPLLKPIWKAQWGAAAQTQTFYDKASNPALLAVSNTPFTFERNRLIWGTFLDAFRQPAFIVIAVTLVALLLTAIFWPVLPPSLQKILSRH